MGPVLLRRGGIMRPTLFTIALLVAACDEPDPAPQEPSPSPRGEQVIDGVIWQLYQDGDRVEQVPVLEALPEDLDPNDLRRCGYLTDRAMEDIRLWTARLDPTHDYNDDATDCTATDNFSRILLPEFEHSPFACGLACCGCCAPDLSRLNYVYASAIENLHGDSLPDQTDEPYIAIDPDRPCHP